MTTQTHERAYTPWWTFALAVLGALFAFGAFLASAAQSPVMKGFAQSEVAGKGIVARDGKLEFAVTDVRRGVAEIGDTYFGTAATSGTYTIVRLSVHNVSTEAVTFDGSYVVGVDRDGHRVPSDREAQYYANEDGAGMLSTLAPGRQIETSVAFDVPAGAKLTGVQVHDSAFSRGAVITFRG